MTVSAPAALLHAPQLPLEEESRSPAVHSADEVAALATERIMAMARSELIEVIRSIRGAHLRPGVVERLPDMDGETLRRLVFVTRRYCRNRQSLEGAGASPGHVAICWG